MMQIKIWTKVVSSWITVLYLTTISRLFKSFCIGNGRSIPTPLGEMEKLTIIFSGGDVSKDEE